MNFDDFDDGYEDYSAGFFFANNLTGNQDEDEFDPFNFDDAETAYTFLSPEALKHDTDFLLC